MGDKFLKRPGTTDRGKEYEDNLVAYFGLSFLKNNQIQKFGIWSNDGNFGSFDDLIIDAEDSTNQRIKYAVQLKHVTKKKPLALESLEGKGGRFGIKSYFESFKKIKKNIPDYKLILWTNLEMMSDEMRIQISDGENIPVRITKVENLPFLHTSGQGKCYKFEITPVSSLNTKIEEYRQFFSCFFLYTNQLNVDEVKTQVRKQMDLLVSNKFNLNHLTDNYIKFISEWSLKNGSKSKLDREMMQTHLTFCMPDLHIYPFEVNENVNDQLKLFQKAISNFDVTIFDIDKLEEVRKIWGDFLNPNKDCIAMSKNLWSSGDCPLILEENSSAHEAIKLCPNRKFVLIRSKDTKKIVDNLKVFEKLSDLKKCGDIFDDVTKTFTCSIDNKKSTLEEVLRISGAIENMVSTNDLLSMANDCFSITTQQEETLPEPHINTYMTKNIFDLKIIDKIDENTLFVISNVSQEQKRCLRAFNLISIDETTDSDEEFRSEVTNLYISSHQCSTQKIKDLHKETNKIVHHFNLVEDRKLEWINTFGRIFDLQQMRHKNDDRIGDKDLFHKSRNGIHLITGDSGSGKSVFLKFVKNNLSSKYLTVMFSSQNMASWCRRSSEDEVNNNVNSFTEFVIDCKFGECKEYEKEVVRTFLEKGKVVYLWDGLDEISDKDRHTIRKLILVLSETVVEQWITTRSELESVLEEDFSILSRKILPFDDQQQEKYIRSRLKSSLKDEIDDIIKCIKDNTFYVLNTELLGIPIQMYMITELFIRNSKKYKTLFMEKSFCLINLYDHFVEEQFNHYFQEKIIIFKDDVSREVHMRSFMAARIRNYKEAALKTMFDDDFIKKLNIKYNDFFEEIEKCDYVGLITGMAADERRPYFLHNSYSEYFIAKYLAENYKRISDFKFIFQRSFRHVRFFFDMIVAGNSKLHIAVLYKNLKYLEEHQDEFENTDNLGRNVLHLASSWGESYPLLEVTKEKCDSGDDFYVVNDNMEPNFKEESSDYIKMLKFLLERCSTTQRDKLFKYNPIEYAESSECLFAKARIAQNENMDYLKDESFICNIMYYGTKFGDTDMVDMVDFSRYIETTNGKSLLYIAVENNRTYWVQKFLLIEKYRSSISSDSESYPSALYIACIHGYEDVIQILVEAGLEFSKKEASLNDPSEITSAVKEEKFSPLHFAAFHGFVELVQPLVSAKENVNSKNSSGFTPLHIACLEGRTEMVHKLVIAGANVDVTSRNGMTPLYIASHRGFKDIVQYLIEECEADVDVRCDGGYTALHAAADQNNTEVMELLIKSNADVNAAVDISKKTVLHFAVKNNNEEAVKMLIKKANIEAANSCGTTPLGLACCVGFLAVAKILIDSGANVDARAIHGTTPLIEACIYGHYNVVKLLINSGADKEAIDIHNLTPIGSATYNGHKEVAKLLLTAGADITLIKKSSSPVHYFCKHNFDDHVRHCIEMNGANKELENENGWRPIHVAAFLGYEETIKVLLKYGVDCDSTTTDGQTAFSLAAESKHWNIVKIIDAYKKRVI